MGPACKVVGDGPERRLGGLQPRSLELRERLAPLLAAKFEVTDPQRCLAREAWIAQQRLEGGDGPGDSPFVPPSCWSSRSAPMRDAVESSRSGPSSLFVRDRTSRGAGAGRHPAPFGRGNNGLFEPVPGVAILGEPRRSQADRPIDGIRLGRCRQLSNSPQRNDRL